MAGNNLSDFANRPLVNTPGYSTVARMKKPQVTVIEYHYCGACGRYKQCCPAKEVVDSEGKNRRLAPLCQRCTDNDPSLIAAEVVVDARNQQVQQEYIATTKKYRRRGAPIAGRAPDGRCRNGAGQAGRCWAAWRAPLLAALGAKGRMTAEEIGDILGCHPGGIAVARARRSGIDLIVVGTFPGKLRRPKNFYGLAGDVRVASA